MYEKAKRDCAEMMAEEIIAIADDSSNDTFIDDEGVEHTNHEHINRSRLRVDSRKWLLSKLLPNKFGDKVDVKHGTVDGDPLQQLVRAVQGSKFRPVKIRYEDSDE